MLFLIFNWFLLSVSTTNYKIIHVVLVSIWTMLFWRVYYQYVKCLQNPSQCKISDKLNSVLCPYNRMISAEQTHG